MREFSIAEEEAYYYSLEQEERTWMQEIGFVNGTDENVILNLVQSFGFKIDFKMFRCVVNIVRGGRLNG